jgi:hypothetical protein
MQLALFFLVASGFGVVCLVPLYAQVFIEGNERSTSPRPADLRNSFENYASSRMQISPPFHMKIQKRDLMLILPISFVINDTYIFRISKYCSQMYILLNR